MQETRARESGFFEDQHFGRIPSHTTRVVITPELAAEWLKYNKKNRTLNRGRVEKLVGALERGEWILNGETIKFDWFHNLIDGQTRLTAIVESGISAESDVTWGLNPKSQDTVDLNKTRTLSDGLGIRGYPASTHLAAAASLYHRYLEYEAGRSMFNKGGSEKYPTVPQGLDLVEANSGIVDHLQRGTNLNHALRIPPAVAVFTSYLTWTIHPVDSKYFFDALHHGVYEDGQTLIVGDPILALRNLFISWLKERTDPKKRRRSNLEFAAVILKAWNHFRNADAVKQIRWKRGGKKPDSFPVAH